MLDVRPWGFVVPIPEQEIGPLTPVVRVQNFADEDAVITGIIRIYRETLGTMLYSSQLQETALPHGATAEIPALTPWNPGAPATHDYFVLGQLTVRSTATGQLETLPVNQFWFDITPAPMGPVPGTHHTTHEAGGMDPLNVTGMPGLLADEQTPLPHAQSHHFGQSDPLKAEDLGTAILDPTMVLAPLGDGSVHFRAESGGSGHARQHAITSTADHTSAATPGQMLKADANGLPIDASNTDTEVTSAVSLKHSNATDHAKNSDSDLDSVFKATLEKVANKGVAGGYCGLPNPLDSTLPLRADGTAARPVGLWMTCDFVGQNQTNNAPWYITAITSGTVAALAGTATHPGIIQFKSATGANSGYYCIFGTSTFLIAGGESTDFVFRPQTLAGTTIRAGFHDTAVVTAPVDGCYLHMDPVTALMTGRTMNNSNSSTTGTNYQLVTNTWYRGRVKLNADASRVDFYLFDDAGNQLWTDNLTTNIPTSAGRETGHGLVATNSGTSAVALVDLDLITLYVPDRRPQV
jgi:hypothetical protein